MKGPRLSPIGNCKADEIAFIERLEKYFAGKDLYLASLFTPAFSNWVRVQIRDDFPPDMFSALTSDKDRARYQMEIGELTRRLSSIQSEVSFEKNGLESAIEKLKADLQNANTEFAWLRKQYDELLKGAAQLSQSNNELSAANNQLDRDLTRLKSRLFDLMEKEKPADSPSQD